MATKTNQVFPSLQADDGFVLTPSDSLNVVSDPNNSIQLYQFVYVKNNSATAGSVKVTTVHGTDLTLYINAGAIEPIAVRRVWSTGTTATPLIGYVGHQKV